MIRFLLLLLLLPSLVLAQTFPTITLWSDDFERPNENPAAAPWVSPMESGESNCQISGGNLIRSGASFASCYRNVAVGGGGGSIEVVGSLPNADSHNPGSTVRLLFCLQGGLGGADPDGYGVQVLKRDGADDEFELIRLNNGGYNQEGDTIFREFGSGDLIGATWETGGNLTMYHKPAAGAWTEIETATDTTFDCSGNTYAGLQINHGTLALGAIAYGATEVPTLGNPFIYLRLVK